MNNGNILLTTAFTVEEALYNVKYQFGLIYYERIKDITPSEYSAGHTFLFHL